MFHCVHDFEMPLVVISGGGLFPGLKFDEIGGDKVTAAVWGKEGRVDGCGKYDKGAQR